MIRSFVNLLRYVTSHPINRTHKVRAISQLARFQLGSRLLNAPVAVPFTDRTRLLVGRGMKGATGNVYCGLHEFEDMGFALHYLRDTDLFVDVGANVGSYSVLAAGHVGCSAIAFEPIPQTFQHLTDNANLNRLNKLLQVHQLGIGGESGTLEFVASLGPMNRVAVAADTNKKTLSVDVVTLDEAMVGHAPEMIKVDVEGYESKVLDGGASTFTDPKLQVVLIETNESGHRYGIGDSSLHSRMSDFGFTACVYDPTQRQLSGSRQQNKYGNTLYVRDIAVAQARVKNAPSFSVKWFQA